MPDPNEEQIRKRLDELGSEQVRLLYENAGFSPSWHLPVTAWLAEQAENLRARSESNQQEQTRIARSAQRAAWIAAYGAIAAAAIGIITIIVTVYH
jgi:hypothetical protein